MDSSRRVEHWQAEKINNAIGPFLGYLVRLQHRMEKTGFTRNDRLYQFVCSARDAAQGLVTETHYLSCRSGVGRPLEVEPKVKDGSTE